MAAIYSNGGNRWNILGFNFTKRDALSSVYKISMVRAVNCMNERVHEAKIYTPWYILGGGGDHYKNYYPTEAEMYVSYHFSSLRIIKVIYNAPQ